MFEFEYALEMFYRVARKPTEKYKRNVIIDNSSKKHDICQSTPQHNVLCQMSSCIDIAGSWTTSPGLNAGIPRYGHEEHRNASPR